MPKQKKKKPPHRPTDWRVEYNQKIIEYFSDKVGDPFREVEDEKGRVQLIPERVPTFEKFADSIGVNCDTVVEWAKEDNKAKYPGFSAAYARAKQLQKDFILSCGMAGAGNPQFAIFMLKNNHGMKDTTDHTNDGGKFEPPVIVNPGGDMKI